MENEQVLTAGQVPEPMKEKAKIPLHEAVFAWCFFGISFIFTHFCVRYFGGIWGGIFWSVFGILGAVYAKIKSVKFSKFQTVMFIAAELFCFAPLFSANVFINFLAAMFSFALYLYLMTVLSGAEPFGRHFVLDMVLSVLVRPFENFTRQPRYAFGIFKGKTRKGELRIKNALYALIGLVLAIPLTIVVVALLMHSDELFSKSMEEFFKSLPKLSFSYFWELLFAVPIAMYLFGAACGMKSPAPPHSYSEPQYRFIPPIMSYFAVTPICVFYLIYIVTQFQNIASFANNTPNHSEFARRGFFELCAIAVINLFVIVLIQTFSKRKENDVRPAALRVYTILISVFTLLIIATAMTKMLMYVGEYGMTLLRVYTSWFMILLGVIFVPIIILQLREIPVWKVFFWEFVLMFGLLCFGDFEGQIARYNIRAYQSGAIEKLDVSEFSELGFSAVKPAAELLKECDDAALAYELRRFLSSQEYSDTERGKFAYFSIPRALAQKEFAAAQYASGEIALRVDVNTEDDVYGVSVKYYIDRDPVESQTSTLANGKAVKKGESLEFSLRRADLEDPAKLGNKRLGVGVSVIGKNGEEIPVDGICEWYAAWDGEYAFTLKGDRREYTLSPDFKGYSFEKIV